MCHIASSVRKPKNTSRRRIECWISTGASNKPIKQLFPLSAVKFSFYSLFIRGL